MVAFILFGILSAIEGGLAHQLDAARMDRLIVDTKFGTQLPLAYLDQIARLDGVTVVAPRQILVGYYQDPKVPFGIIMTDRRFFGVRPELNATREQIDTLLKTRTGALITVFSAKRFGWKVGDKVPVISNTIRRDGTHTWTFDIVGIIDDVDRPGKSRYFISNYDYMDQERVTNKGTIDRILVRIKDPKRATQTSREIDALFANLRRPHPHHIGKIRPPGGRHILHRRCRGLHPRRGQRGVVHAAVLTGNTMMQSVRERIPEFAVLKTLGFSDRSVLMLVLAEAPHPVRAGCGRGTFDCQDRRAPDRRRLARPGAIVADALVGTGDGFGLCLCRGAGQRADPGAEGPAHQHHRGAAPMRQLLAVTWMSLRTVPARWGSSLVVVVGMACAVGALVSILSMSAGFLRTMAATGSPSRAIVISDGALGEWGSTITHDEATILADMPGVANNGAHKAGRFGRLFRLHRGVQEIRWPGHVCGPARRQPSGPQVAARDQADQRPLVSSRQIRNRGRQERAGPVRGPEGWRPCCASLRRLAGHRHVRKQRQRQ